MLSHQVNLHDVVIAWKHGLVEKCNDVHTNGMELIYKDIVIGFTKEDRKIVKNYLRGFSNKILKNQKLLLIALQVGYLDNDIGCCIYKLDTLRLNLLKYCHDSTCEAYVECPNSHYKCSENLDLDTSIAYEIATSISQVKFLTYKRRVKKLSEVVNVISHMYYVIFRHGKKYSDLMTLVDRCYAISHQLYVDVFNNVLMKREVEIIK